MIFFGTRVGLPPFAKFIMKIWNTDTNIPPYIKDGAPAGKRIPDGIIWAYEASGFYWVSDSDVVWSRSMIEEFGGCLDDDELVSPEPSPCRLTPWLSRQSILYDANGVVKTRALDEIGGVDEDSSSPALPVAEVCRMLHFSSQIFDLERL
jgi:hypothetical protein